MFKNYVNIKHMRILIGIMPVHRALWCLWITWKYTHKHMEVSARLHSYTKDLAPFAQNAILSYWCKRFHPSAEDTFFSLTYSNRQDILYSYTDINTLSKWVTFRNISVPGTCPSTAECGLRKMQLLVNWIWFLCIHVLHIVHTEAYNDINALPKSPVK